MSEAIEAAARAMEKSLAWNAAIAVLRQHFGPTGDESKCDLCVGKCRGHSLGSEWVPEIGSRAWKEQQPDGDVEGLVGWLEKAAMDLAGHEIEEQIPICLKLSEAAARITADQARIAELEGNLTDPQAVHVNMLRGGIAKPSPANIWHIYGRELLDAMPDELRQALGAKP